MHFLSPAEERQGQQTNLRLFTLEPALPLSWNFTRCCSLTISTGLHTFFPGIVRWLQYITLCRRTRHGKLHLIHYDFHHDNVFSKLNMPFFVLSQCTLLNYIKLTVFCCEIAPQMNHPARRRMEKALLIAEVVTLWNCLSRNVTVGEVGVISGKITKC